MVRSIRRLIPLAFLGLLGATLPAHPHFDKALLSALKYRNLGAFRAGGWTTAIAVPDTPERAHLYWFYVGTRNGGVFKTTNGGDTFEPIFDEQDVESIGALAVSPKDPNVLWVGTGDSYFARSPYFGNGVYKTTDGGKSWAHLGLVGTEHISQILIDPHDPNVVYVAAMGHAYTPNAQRGVYKTTDGGKTWTKSLYVDDHTGAIDLAMDPKNPKVLYAAMWYRATYHPGAARPRPGAKRPLPPQTTGIYKTEDGGKTWHKLKNGLPTGRIGRIGLALFPKNPKIVYAIVANENMRPLTEAEKKAAAAGGGSGGGFRGGNRNERRIGTEIYRTEDAGGTWHKMNSVEDDPGSKAPGTFTIMRVDTQDPNLIFSLTDNMLHSPDGGRTWPGLNLTPEQAARYRRGYRASGTHRPQRYLLQRNFGDFRTLWIDPQNDKRWLIGSDGGLFASYDGGKTSEHFGNLPLGEINSIAVDNDNPYHVYIGEQDHEHWRAPVDSWSGGLGPSDWVTVGNGDGETDAVDPTNSRWLYTTSENGQHKRVDQKYYTQTSIVPHIPGAPRLRYNWTTPLVLSPHDPAIVYTGAQFLLRSMDRGDHWAIISPDLTVPPGGDTSRVARKGSDGATGASARRRGGTITTISESPAKAGVIWVGTTTGRVQVTWDAGQTWTDVTDELAAAGAPDHAPITSVFASRFHAGTAFVAESRYNWDDPSPFLYETTDYGATWTSISGNLPKRSINVVEQDTQDPDLLFAGTDGGAWVTNDGGRRWVSLRCNMPGVAVMAMTIQPRESDLLLGSYGRGIWMMNIAPLREMSEENLSRPVYFFKVRPRGAMTQHAMGNYRFYGYRNLITPNEPSGLTAYFYLRDKPSGSVALTVTDASGKEIRKIDVEDAKQGLNQVLWNLMPDPARGHDAGVASSAGSARGGSPREPVAPGEYLMTLQVGSRKLTQPAKVLPPVRMAPPIEAY